MPKRKKPLEKEAIRIYFGTSDQKVFIEGDIREILGERRKLWNCPVGMSLENFIDYLINDLNLKRIRLTSPHYEKEYVRYAWEDVPIYQLALSLRSRSNFSHHTSMILHGLTDEPSQRIYVNTEQSAKPRRDGSINQDSIDLALSRKARTSKYVFTYKEWNICCLNGLYTNRLGIENIPGPNGIRLPITNIERTLIDIAVRPVYTGGTHDVLKAYGKAKGKTSVDRLVKMLKKIDYIYPYHQIIGFYMQRAGFNDRSLNLLKNMGMNYDFYLDYEIKDKAYSKEWRLYYPSYFDYS